MVFEGVELNKAKKREAPAPVKPVTHNGLRYEVVHWGRTRGLSQNGGYIAVIDPDIDKEVGLIKVYPVKYKWWGMEKDKQDIFITEIELDAKSESLLVSDERSRRYRVEIESQKVQKL